MNWKKLENDISMGSIVILIFGLVACTIYFYIGFHNVDLAYNMERFTCGINNAQDNFEIGSLTDIGSDFIERPLHEYYITGLNYMRGAFYFGLLDIFCLAWLLAEIFKNNEKIKNR